jgi:DNA-binding NtrC family response regulator
MQMTENETCSKVKALIIDDDMDICFLLSGILKRKNFETDYVTSLTEAKKFLQKNISAPPVIFLDNHLPDGLGVDYLSQLKKTCPSAKIIMISAHSTFTDREKAFENGADYFIGKPFTRDMIFQTIEKFSGQTG